MMDALRLEFVSNVDVGREESDDGPWSSIGEPGAHGCVT